MITYKQLLQDFQQAGIQKGDVIFVQSAMRPIGLVEGGAATVARALWDAVGSEGTLVAPAFCFTHQKVPTPIVDPRTDPSEVGAISEAVRNLPGALRSVAYRHSISAVGKLAAAITQVDPKLSVFDMLSSFGKMLGYDAKILLLGVTYRNSTSHHFAQYLMQMPDREVVPMSCLLRSEDGNLVPITLDDYRPRPRTDGQMYTYKVDFCRSGVALEKAGLVQIGHAGNAITRLFRLRDLIHYFIDRYAVEDNLFAEGPEGFTELPDGQTVTATHYNASGDAETVYWSCVNADQITYPKGR